MNVETIMSKNPLCVNDNEYITHARQLMRDNFLRGLPVVDDSNRVLGIITDQDILNVRANKSNVTVKGYTRECPIITPEMDILKASKLLLKAKENRVPVVTSSTEKKISGILSDVDILKNIPDSKIPSKCVSEIMTTDVMTINPEETVAKLWANMIDWNYTGVPVVDNKGEVYGIVTRRDIIKSGHARIGASDTHGKSSGNSPKVEKIMSTPLYTITPETKIEQAIAKLLDNNIGRICVSEKDELIGIVDRYDLLLACVK
ncbi:CBS domain-containing protein [Methanosalsum natronophilum]|uniref:CBS domain-containing protein n=1 Tax=Methanosalsum natronophilum TaxID=768733 RepID=UPI002168DF21|nr:CBS domain-containing protein [Methanosalsum natronophilum]MCS3923929.1 CBS domain-containing protein [Methanosalsum natronophilum]